MSDDEHSESELYYLDELEYLRNSEGAGLNCRRVGASNRVLAGYFFLKPYKQQLINVKRSVFTGKSQTSALMYRSVNTAMAQFEIFP